MTLIIISVIIFKIYVFVPEEKFVTGTCAAQSCIILHNLDKLSCLFSDKSNASPHISKELNRVTEIKQ